MKFMGSKRWMLANGLGELLLRETERRNTFVDLFAGSGTVAAFVARQRKVRVCAYDLQSFSVCLANSVIGRTRELDASEIWRTWYARARHAASRALKGKATTSLPTLSKFTRDFVRDVRARCEDFDDHYATTRAYGGHYFFTSQAIWLDALRKTVPRSSCAKEATIAALVRAASQCAASPGHTAQPFQPTRSAKRFLYEAWGRDVVQRTRAALHDIAAQHALVKGRAQVGDANNAVATVSRGDLVFVDPPYSGVHYSRFYHVLETIAEGKAVSVTGVGRYPPALDRPWSQYSVKGESLDAIAELFEEISEQEATAIVTFPDKVCSNGLSGKDLRVVAEEFFSDVSSVVVRNRFSTLGGDGIHRDARQKTNELMLLLRP